MVEVRNAGRNAFRNVPDVLTAVSLEWLLDWAYVRERVGQLCNLVNGAPILAQGSKWDTPSNGYTATGGALPADALRVFAAVGALPGDQRSAVTHYAQVGRYPDPMVGVVPWPMPYKRDPRGRSRNRCRVERIGRAECCPVHYVPTWDEIMASRDAYLSWHAGMTALSDGLLSRRIELERYRLTHPFDAPAEPWQNGDGRPVRHRRANLDGWLLGKKQG